MITLWTAYKGEKGFGKGEEKSGNFSRMDLCEEIVKDYTEILSIF
jgi:hypothetical protein